MTQTCPKDAPSKGPFTAATWDALHPGEIRQTYQPSVTFGSTGGDPSVSRAVDPIAGDGACATTNAADQAAPASATYRLGKVDHAYTLAGAPTVIAKITKQDAGNAQIAARLWDVDADNAKQTLVARTLYRPQGTGGFEVFQLHANGYRFEPGHTAKLELLGADAPYGRASSGTFTITVGDLELRLPVLEDPECKEVLSHAPPFAAGKLLAPDIAPRGTPPCGRVAADEPLLTPGGGPVPTQTSVGAGGDHGSVNGQPVTAAGTPRRARPRARVRTRAVRHRLSCHRRHGRRVSCVDRGRVVPPKGTSARKACASHGKVRVRYFSPRGKRKATRRVRLNAHCGFRSRARFRTDGRRASAKVRFKGNAVLRARSGRRRSSTLMARITKR